MSWLDKKIKLLKSKKSTALLRSAVPSGHSQPPPLPALPRNGPIQVAAYSYQPVPASTNSVLQRREKRQKITAEELRELRELIRYRYALDVELWSKHRKVKPYSRYVAQDLMRKSDSALVKIRRMVEDWDKRSYFSSDDEYFKFQEIKARVEAEGKRNWMRQPPWMEADAAMRGGQGVNAHPHAAT